MKSFVAFLLFVPVAMRVHHQQNQTNQAAEQKNDDDRLISPYHLHKIGGIGVHLLSIYTHIRRNLIFTARWAKYHFEI